MTRLLQIAPVFFNNPNGPTIVLENIVAPLAELDFEIEVFTTRFEGDGPGGWLEKSRIRPLLINHGNNSLMEKEKILRQAIEKADLVHVHGLFGPLFVYCGCSLWWHDVPFVLTPHGGLEREALKKSGWRKRLALKTVLWPLLKNVAAIQFFTSNEQDHAVSCSQQADVYHIPNGVERTVPMSDDPDLVKEVIERRAQVKRVISYAGRLDTNHKGLDRFMEAVLPIRDRLQQLGIQFWIVGDYRSERDRELLAHRFEQLGKLVVLWGARSLAEKNRIISAAEVFFHLSRYEGMPLAVMEALQLGKPVIVTEATNVAGIVERTCCGWVTGPGAKAIRNTILNVAVMDEKILKAAGDRGKSDVRENYRWEVIGASIGRMYREVLGGVLQGRMTRKESGDE
jgi:glycosyltransferase involved in cell wall biosynthesis